MIISAPTANTRQPHYFEGSRMRSLRDADAVSRSWIRAKTSLHRNNSANNQQFFMMQKLGRNRRRIVGGGGSNASAGMSFKGEYNGGAYKTQDVVAFTPDGVSAGFYIALKAVPTGQSPDTGSPYWMAFPAPAPGQWA